jgi:hypothetical protein
MLWVQTQDADRPLIRFAQAFQAFNGGSLAGPIWANHPEDLTLVDLERNIVHGDSRAVLFS